MANQSWSHGVNETANGTLYGRLSHETLNFKAAFGRIILLEKCLSITRLALIPVGVSLVVVLLLAILKSPDVRASMRNKCAVVLGGVCVINLCVEFPLYFTLMNRGLRVQDDCHTWAAWYNFGLVLEFIGNWTLVIFVGSLLGNVCGFQLEKKLSALRLSVLKAAILVTPWIISVISVLLIIRAHLSEEELNKMGCFIEFTKSPRMMKSFNTSIPLSISVIALIAGAVMRRWLADRQPAASTDISVQLLEGSTPVTEHFVYVTALSVTIIFEIPDVIVMFVDIDDWELERAMQFLLVSKFIMDLQTLVTPMAWFLFQDVRGEIKSWSRCVCPTGSRSRVAQYERESATAVCPTDQSEMVVTSDPF